MTRVGRIKYERGSGNIFRDFGLPDPDMLLLKAELSLRVIRLLQARGLAQAAAARLLGVSRVDISRLKGSSLSRYSIEQLMGFLNKLDQRIEIRIRPSTRTKAAETVLA